MPNLEEAKLMMETQSEQLKAETTDKYWVSDVSVNSLDSASFEYIRKLFWIRYYDVWYSVRAVRAF